MRVHAFMECSLVNGPGRRAVVWLQGCELGCQGCWNPVTHLHGAGSETSVGELASRIASAYQAHSLQGITISGGEPLHQISDVIRLLTLLKQQLSIFSAGLFTGYTEAELNRGNFHTYLPSSPVVRQDQWRQLRVLLDFAVLGRFNSRQASPTTPLITSRNQRLQLFSDHYCREDFREQQIEVTIDASGLTQITGFPTLGSIL